MINKKFGMLHGSISIIKMMSVSTFDGLGEPAEVATYRYFISKPQSHLSDGDTSREITV